jgi:hypothetical protein
MRALIIAVIAVVIYERYDTEILAFGKNLVWILKNLMPR